MDARKELCRLMLDGLMGRSHQKLFEYVAIRFLNAGDRLPYATFEGWILGEHFPSTRRRQDLLADAVGGPCGEAIRKLKAPAFRGYRLAKAKENDMGNGRRGWQDGGPGREFPLVMRPDGGGRLVKQAQIVCAVCSATYHHHRRGSVDSDQYFKSKGWEVGKRNAAEDVCPNCIFKRKVVKMSDHVKPPAAAAAESSKKDRRVLLLFIQEHWDENVDRYQVGWSDAKIAEDTGKPIEMVREVREAEFDGPGEDPGMVAFLEQQVAVSEELGVLARHLKELEASVKTTVAAWSEEVAKTDRVLKGYQQAHMALNAKVAALTQVADRVRQTEKKAG